MSGGAASGSADSEEKYRNSHGGGHYPHRRELHSGGGASLITPTTTPGLRITIISDSIKNLYRKLEDYDVDLIVVEGRNTDNRYSSLLLDTDSLVLAVSPESPLAKKSMVSLEELKKEKMIVRGQGSATRQLFEDSLHGQGLSLSDFNVILEVDNIATIKDLILKNIGVAVLAKSACTTLEAIGRS
jgi:DNA-binding transcriptional LysR family regulator